PQTERRRNTAPRSTLHSPASCGFLISKLALDVLPREPTLDSICEPSRSRRSSTSIGTRTSSSRSTRVTVKGESASVSRQRYERDIFMNESFDGKVALVTGAG